MASSVFLGSGGSLAGLSDVTLTGPTDDQALVYDIGLTKWVNGSGGGGNPFDQDLNTTDVYRSGGFGVGIAGAANQVHLAQGSLLQWDDGAASDAGYIQGGTTVGQGNSVNIATGTGIGLALGPLSATLDAGLTLTLGAGGASWSFNANDTDEMIAPGPILPATDGTGSLGLDDQQWGNIFGTLGQFGGLGIGTAGEAGFLVVSGGIKSPSGVFGEPLVITGGLGSDSGGNVGLVGGDGGSGNGGSASVTSGYGDTQGGAISLTSGNGGLTGGSIFLTTGTGSDGNGGDIIGTAGAGTAGGHRGGNIRLEPGTGNDDALNGNLLLTALPTSDPVIADAVWNDGNVLVQSGTLTPTFAQVNTPLVTQDSGDLTISTTTSGQVIFDAADGVIPSMNGVMPFGDGDHMWGTAYIGAINDDTHTGASLYFDSLISESGNGLTLSDTSGPGVQIITQAVNSKVYLTGVAGVDIAVGLSVSGDVTATGYIAGAAVGIDTTITTGSLVGKTITVMKGLITGFA